MVKYLLKCWENEQYSLEIDDNIKLEEFKISFNWYGIENINFYDLEHEKIEISSQDDLNYWIANLNEMKNEEIIKICNYSYKIFNEDIGSLEISNNNSDIINNNIELIDLLQNNSVFERERTIINNNNSFHNLTVKNNNDINNTFNIYPKNDKKNEDSQFFINENINYNIDDILNEKQNIEEIISNRIQLFLSKQIPKLITDIRKNYLEYENKNNFLYQNLCCINCNSSIGKDEYYGCFDCKKFFLCKNCEIEVNHIHCMVKIKSVEQHKEYLKKINEMSKIKNQEIEIKDNLLESVEINEEGSESPLKKILNDSKLKWIFKKLVELFGKEKINQISNLIIDNPNLTEEDYIMKLMD